MSTSIAIILIINVIVSLRGFNNEAFFRKYMFHVDSILVRKEYIRLISSAFLHGNTTHLLFNMLSFYFFAPTLISEVGDLGMWVIYLGSLLGGNFLSLFMQRKNGDYSAIGASGAVSGIVFATIAIVPGMSLYLFFIPIPIPAYIYGLLYMIYSINGIRKQSDNIGHEAHLGGAAVGVLLGLFFQPLALVENTLTISLILVPVIVFLAILMFRPQLLFVGMDYERNQEYKTKDDSYNLSRQRREERLDYLLDKINRSGLNSLSEEEKEFLDKYS